MAELARPGTARLWPAWGRRSQIDRQRVEGDQVETSAKRPPSPGAPAVPASRPSFGDALASVVATNAALIKRILEHGAWLTCLYDEKLITKQVCGGEMYRLAKAVRHANDLLVSELADHLPMSVDQPKSPISCPGAEHRHVGDQCGG
jgi:hypothetical protein